MQKLRQTIDRAASDLDMDALGVADAALVNDRAPDGFRPRDMLPEAKSVVVIAQRMPVGASLAFAEDDTREMPYMHAFWTSEEVMNRAAYTLARILDAAGYPSLTVPAYGPLRISGNTTRGMLSLKHTAALAGLGVIGRNSLLISPDFGNLLRLAAVVTPAPLPTDDSTGFSPCPEGCTACRDACPVNAIGEYRININRCMKRSIRHPLMQPFVMTRLLFWLSSVMEPVHSMTEDLTNMMADRYAESCVLCLAACPHFKKGTTTPTTRRILPEEVGTL